MIGTVIRKKGYVIATKSFPLQFPRGPSDCHIMVDIEHAYICDSKEFLKEELSKLPNPDDFQILELTATYEL